MPPKKAIRDKEPVEPLKYPQTYYNPDNYIHFEFDTTYRPPQKTIPMHLYVVHDYPYKKVEDEDK